MIYTLTVAHRANIHLIKAVNWCIDQEKKGLEVKFIKAVDSAITYIQKNPLKSQVRYKDVRIRFLRTPKFGVHYVIQYKHIYVIGIFHTNHDSENW